MNQEPREWEDNEVRAINAMDRPPDKVLSVRLRRSVRSIIDKRHKTRPHPKQSASATPAFCPIHPRYRAFRAPKAPCPTCVQIWVSR